MDGQVGQIAIISMICPTDRSTVKTELCHRLQVLRHIGADAQSSVMFEDSLKNVVACRKLGMATGMEVHISILLRHEPSARFNWCTDPHTYKSHLDDLLLVSRLLVHAIQASLDVL